MRALVCLVTVTLVICSTAAVGQTEYPALREVSYLYQGGGARALAMGGAFVGLANDVTSGQWNPAGLVVMERPTIAGSYNLYNPAGQFENSLTPMVTKDNLEMSGISHFSFVAPVRIKGHPWVFDFNYNRDNLFSAKEAYLADAAHNLNPDSYFEEKGYLQTFSAGFSTRIYRQFSMGFTVNIIDGRRMQDLMVNSVRDSVIDEVYQISIQKYTTDRLIDSTTGNGFNFTLGTMLKKEKFSVGAVVRTPFTMRNNTDRSQFVVTTSNDLPTTEDSDTTYVVDSLAKQDIPLAVTVGGVLIPMEKLSLTADVSYHNYGSTKWYYRTETFFSAGGDRTDTYETLPIDWNNTIGVGIGAEYVLDLGFGDIPLRGGFRYDQLPQPKEISRTQVYVLDEEGLPTTEVMRTFIASGRQNETTLSVGTGIRWSLIQFDVAYRYISGAELTLKQDDFGEASQELMERKAHEITLTFTGLF